MAARAADDDGREQHDGLGVAPRRRRPEVDEPDQDRAAQPGQHAAEHEHRGAQRQQVLAQRVGHDVVVAHRPQRPAVRRFGHPPHQQVDRGRQDQRDRRIQPLVALGLRVVLALQRSRDQGEPRGPVQRRPVVRDQQVGHDRGDQERDRGEVAAQPPPDQERERQRDQAAHDHRADPGDRPRQVPPADVGLESAVGALAGQRQDRGGVRARRLEDNEAEVSDPGHAELLAQAEAGDDVDAGVDQQVDEVEQLRAAHQVAAPSTPPGRAAITISSTRKAITSLYDGVM